MDPLDQEATHKRRARIALDALRNNSDESRQIWNKSTRSENDYREIDRLHKKWDRLRKAYYAEVGASTPWKDLSKEEQDRQMQITEEIIAELKAEGNW